MKKLLFICIVCLCTTLQTKAQLPDTTNVNRSNLDANSIFKKAKKQQATALILLLTGTIITTGGLVAVQEEGIFTDNFTTYGAIILAGGATMLSSIPFFIASGKNKRKANLALKTEKGNTILYKLNYPALALRVKL